MIQPEYSFQVCQLYEDLIIGGRHSKYYNMLSLIFYYTCKFHFKNRLKRETEKKNKNK